MRQETASLGTQELLQHVVARFGQGIALASSLSAEDQVVTDMLVGIVEQPRIFTLDTGRLPQETYDAIDATRKKYGIELKVLFPDTGAVERMVAERGVNLFYDSIENRKLCCAVRKVEPLKRELAGLEAWMTGLRREQAATRGQLERIEWDQGNGLIKVNPLIDWTAEDVWQYVRERDVPCNALHDKGYPSIGCAPCTRAIAAGESLRDGRWWWEDPEQKECGLHVQDGKLVRKKNG